jgi:hypothetical protein
MGLRDLVARITFPPRGVRLLRQTRPHNCVQTVLAMSLNLPIATVEKLAGTQGMMETGEVFGLLARLGVFYRPISASLMADCWPSFWYRSGGRQLRGMGVRRPTAKDRIGHAYFIAGSVIYDPATGKTRSMNPSTLSDIDWLALFPTDIADNPALRSLGAALSAR